MSAADPSSVEQKSHCEVRERGAKEVDDGTAQKERAGQQEGRTGCDTGVKMCNHMKSMHLLTPTELCKKMPTFRECLAEILCHSATLGWAAEHFESDL